MAQYEIDETGLLTIPTDSDLHPWNRSCTSKYLNFFLNASAAFSAMVGATGPSGALSEISERFDVSTEVVLINTTVYLVGVTLGSIVCSSVSESLGRKYPLAVSLFCCGVITMATGNMDGIGALIIYRFVAGIFAGGPLSITTGALTDLLPPEGRILLALVYTTMTIVGAAAGPTFLNLINTYYSSAVSMRWVGWCPGIAEMALGLFCLFALEETYLLIIEDKLARKQRKTTGKTGITSRMHREDRTPFKELVTRPFRMFFTPTLLCYNGLSGFSYGVFFIMLDTIPQVFSEVYGFGRTTSQLPIYAFVIGFLWGSGLMVVFDKMRIRTVAKKIHKIPPPEIYLEMMLAGAPFLPAGCFFYGWTLYPSVHWIVPCVALGLAGLGFCAIYSVAIMYIVQFYTTPRVSYSASAVASNLLIRNPMAGGFPLFARQMYHHLGNHWASSLLAFLLLFSLPIALTFYLHGDRIRKNDYMRRELETL